MSCKAQETERDFDQERECASISKEENGGQKQTEKAETGASSEGDGVQDSVESGRDRGGKQQVSSVQADTVQADTDIPQMDDATPLDVDLPMPLASLAPTVAIDSCTASAVGAASTSEVSPALVPAALAEALVLCAGAQTGRIAQVVVCLSSGERLPSHSPSGDVDERKADDAFRAEDAIRENRSQEIGPSVDTCIEGKKGTDQEAPAQSQQKESKASQEDCIDNLLETQMSAPSPSVLSFGGTEVTCPKLANLSPRETLGEKIREEKEFVRPLPPPPQIVTPLNSTAQSFASEDDRKGGSGEGAHGGGGPEDVTVTAEETACTMEAGAESMEACAMEGGGESMEACTMEGGAESAHLHIVNPVKTSPACIMQDDLIAITPVDEEVGIGLEDWLMPADSVETGAKCEVCGDTEGHVHRCDGCSALVHLQCYLSQEDSTPEALKVSLVSLSVRVEWGDNCCVRTSVKSRLSPAAVRVRK
jgi:hypothetical protein